MSKSVIAFAASYLVVGGVGYALAPREMLDTEAKQSGFFTVDTKKVLSATVSSLRTESKVLVYSYKGYAQVSVQRDRFWGLLGGSQELIVPAGVAYYLNMTNLTLEDVTYDEKSKIVRVQLPALEMGDVSFQPENAKTVNGGILTFSQTQIDELNRLAYSTARKAFTKQAQASTLVQLAKSQAKLNVQTYFEIPLRIVGHPDVRVVPVFATP